MKPRRSKIRDLPADQRTQVEAWLFQDNLTYAQIIALCKERFGLDLLQSSLSEHRQGLEKKGIADAAFDRLLSKVSQSASSANAQMEAVEHLKAQYSEALMGRVSQLAFEASLKGETFDLETLKGFMEIAALEIKTKTDAKKINQKDEEITLQRDKFQFDAAKACLKELPSLRQISANPALNENDKINAVRARLFGQLPTA